MNEQNWITATINVNLICSELKENVNLNICEVNENVNLKYVKLTMGRIGHATYKNYNSGRTKPSVVGRYDAPSESESITNNVDTIKGWAKPTSVYCVLFLIRLYNPCMMLTAMRSNACIHQQTHHRTHHSSARSLSVHSVVARSTQSSTICAENKGVSIDREGI